MDVDSRENGFAELGGFPKEDGSTLAAEYDLSFVVNKEVNDEDYVNDGLANCNEFQDCNEQVQQVPPSSDLRSHEISVLSLANFHSPPQTGFDSDVFPNKTSFVGDQVSSQQSGSGVSAHPQKLPLIEDSNQEDEMEDSPPSPPHDKTVTETVLEPSKCESTESEFAFNEVEDEVSDIKTEKLYSSPSSHYGNIETKSETIICSRNSPDESKKLEVLHSDQYNIEGTPQLSTSPGTVRQMAVTPGMSPGVSKQGFQELSYSSRSHGKENCFSPERSDLGKEASKDNSSRAGRKNRDSPRRKRQGSPHLDNASVECVLLSLRNHGSHQKHRRRDRSVSQSPVRRRDSSSVHKRDHRNRSRSRSPYKRDHRRRSPRRRYSPRRRSPSGYQSYRRSPKRRHWSPPHDRSTGLGKPGRDLFVAGFSFLTTERDLERKFARFGRVGDVRIVRDKRSGDSRGFGFLSLEKDEEADAAIRALDKTQWNGRIVLVEKSKSH